MLVEIAEYRAFPAAECVIGDGNRDRHIYADHPHLYPACEVTCRIAVLREDCNAVAVFMFVCQT